MVFHYVLCMQKGVTNMSAKMGRPKLDDPKSIKLTVKMDKATLAKLNEVAEAYSLSKGQVVRQGIEVLHRRIKK